MHLVFKFGDKDKHNIKIHCDVNDKIGDVITKFHEKHGRKYTKVIIDGDVISTADYKKTLSQLEIEDEDCIQVRDWKTSFNKIFSLQKFDFLHLD